MGMNVVKAKVMRISRPKSPAQDMIKKTGVCGILQLHGWFDDK
jgi:hypothetical protein